MYIYQPIGSSTTLGNYGNRHALSTASGNAASSYLMANLQGFRVSFLGPIGIAFEGGGINDINDKVDELEDIVDRDFTSDVDVEAMETEVLRIITDGVATAAATTTFDVAAVTAAISNAADIEEAITAVTNVVNTTAITDAISEADAYVVSEVSDLLDDIDSTVAEVNDVITDISNTTYVKFSVTTHAPFMPIIYKTRRRGVFMIDASASLVGRAGILADDITLTGLDELRSVTTATDLTDIDLDNVDVETDLSLHIKRASDLRFGIGYSEMVARSETSAFIVGGRVNFHKLALGQKLTVLTEDEDSNVSYGDFLISRDTVESGISLDLGVILAGRNYQLGASIANVNEPTFNYEGLGDCTGLSGADLTSCNAAISFADKGTISLNETYTMEAQMTLDAAIKSKDQHFSLAGSYDVNPIKDPLGDEYQWSVVSLSYFSDNFFFPGMRVGYRKNLVGSELDYLTAGVTFYRRLDFDVAYAEENEDGNSGVSLSMGYSFVF